MKLLYICESEIESFSAATKNIPHIIHNSECSRTIAKNKF